MGFVLEGFCPMSFCLRAVLSYTQCAFIPVQLVSICLCLTTMRPPPINRLHGRVVKGGGHLDQGREFDPRPGQYSRMSFSSDPGDWYGFLI